MIDIDTAGKFVKHNCSFFEKNFASRTSSKQKRLVRQFKKPVPMREVSIVIHRDFLKKRMIDALKKEIILSLPEKINKNKGSNIIPV